MSNTDLDAKNQDSDVPRPSTKNLIKLFETISKTGDQYSTKNQRAILKPGSKQITETFENLKKARDEKKDEETKELESCVSVKSLVCNYQKMSTITRSDVGKISDIPKSSDVRRSPSPRKGSSDTKPQEIEKPTQELIDEMEDEPKISERPQSEIYNQNFIAPDVNEPIDEPENDKAPTSASYVLGSSETIDKVSSSEVSSVDLDSDEEVLDDVPLGNGITPLPISYKVVPNKNGKLDLILPPPPEKSCLKTKYNTRNIEFSEENSYGETYNMMEYARADPDLDIVASTAEFEFEKMFEQLEKIPVTLQRKQNEKLGLQVYGVSVRKSSENNNMAIYVRSVTPGSLCERSGLIHIDDLIIEINDESLIGVGVDKVHEVIKKSSDKISLLLGRDPKGRVS